MAARDDAKGLTACEALKKDGFQPDFYQLDITDEKTVEGLKNYIKSQYGGLDVLINNAGIYFVCFHDVFVEFDYCCLFCLIILFYLL